MVLKLYYRTRSIVSCTKLGTVRSIFRFAPRSQITTTLSIPLISFTFTHLHLHRNLHHSKKLFVRPARFFRLPTRLISQVRRRKNTAQRNHAHRYFYPHAGTAQVRRQPVSDFEPLPKFRFVAARRTIFNYKSLNIHSKTVVTVQKIQLRFSKLISQNYIFYSDCGAKSAEVG